MNKNIIFAFVKKEFKQIIRDFSSILIAFILPLILLFLFGFGINFDTNTVKIGIVIEDSSIDSRDFIQSMLNTKSLTKPSWRHLLPQRQEGLFFIFRCCQKVYLL